MIFRRIIEALYHQPLAITRQGFDSIDAIVRPRVFGATGKFDISAERPDKDFFGNPMPQMEIEDGVAIIPIFGPLLHHADLIDKKCGACSYDDLREELKESSSRGDVRAIILHFNSPGGQIQGCLELAEYIAAVQENGTDVYAWTDTQLCSAAYFLAAACTGIFSTKTAFVGSIGCIMGWMNTAKAHEMAGMKPEIFTSGKYKDAGNSGLEPTDDHRKYVQGIVDESFSQFGGHVLAYRPQISDESMQGQAFFGTDALKAGLIDDIVNDLDDVIELIG